MQIDNLNGIRKERKDTLKIAEATLWKSPEKSDSQRILKSVITNYNKWSLSKLNRWVGYAQCQLVNEGVVTLNELKDLSRNIVKEEEINAKENHE